MTKDDTTEPDGDEPSGKTPGRKRGVKKMTDEHKAAIAAVQPQNYAVGGYLAWLEQHPVHAGRRRTRETVEATLARVDESIKSGKHTPLQRLSLVQQRHDLERELADWVDDDGGELRAAFEKHVAAYSERKGITYAVWREVGVPAAVLSAGGIRATRTSTTREV